MSKTEINIQSKNNIHIVSIIGSIDEHFGVKSSSIPTENEIIFSLEGLKSINSTGIREWIKLMQKLGKQKVSFVFCPKIFIDQLNMVKGFTSPNSKVVSFYVPYYSEDEEVEKSVLFTEGKEFSAGKVNLPAKVVTETGKTMDLDVVEAKYFKFIFDIK